MDTIDEFMEMDLYLVLQRELTEQLTKWDKALKELDPDDLQYCRKEKWLSECILKGQDLLDTLSSIIQENIQ